MKNFHEAGQNDSETVSFGVVQHNLANIHPTSSELGHLWSSYIAESMSVCMLKYMVAKAKAPDVQPVLQRALDVSSQRLVSMEEIFKSVHHPIPLAFGENDVDCNAGELYSEYFSLAYTRLMSEYILIQYSLAFSISSRPDFRNFFSDCINTAGEIIQKACEVLLAKGLFMKAPHINVPDRAEYVYDRNYYGSVFAGLRPLNILEISYIFESSEAINLIRTLAMGFGQTVKSEKIKKFISRGKIIQDEQIQILNSFLEDENLPAPMNSQYEVTNSRESPYSDQLMMTHLNVVTAYTIAGYGLAIPKMARKDLVSGFSRFFTELLEFSKDGTDLMIDHGWLERVPETSDRKDMIQ